jgi:L-amino acid N-acyltransferase YncA
VSFEEVPPDEIEIARRMSSGYPWLVAEDEGTVTGYAYASAHAARPAYRWSVDVSVYLEAGSTGRGTGRALYTELLNRLRARGFVNAYGGVALPNDASLGLHRAMGFTQVGVYEGVGFKHGRWIDVSWWALRLGERPRSPGEPQLSDSGFPT